MLLLTQSGPNNSGERNEEGELLLTFHSFLARASRDFFFYGCRSIDVVECCPVAACHITERFLGSFFHDLNHFVLGRFDSSQNENNQRSIRQSIANDGVVLLGNGRNKELRSIFGFVSIVIAGSGDGDILGDQSIGTQGIFRRGVCLIFEYAA